VTENLAREADVMARARSEAMRAIEDARAVNMLRRYYDPAGDYAGSTFLELTPNEPDNITATDLYALSLLDVRAGPQAGRRLLDDGAHRDAVLTALGDPNLRFEVTLEGANETTFAAAEKLYLAVREALGIRPWVTASKLCARKRPLFFPVRDSVVTLERLRLGKSYLLAWNVYKTLLQDDEVLQKVHARVEKAQAGGEFKISDPPLRILDVLLWMTADASMRPRRGSGAR